MRGPVAAARARDSVSLRASAIVNSRAAAPSSPAPRPPPAPQVIAVDQDASHVPGYRLVGGDLSYPCGGGPPAPAVYSLAAKACDAGDAMQVWRVGGNGSTIGLASGGAGGPVLDDWECAAADGSPVYVGPQDGAAGKCGGRNQLWTWRADGSVVNVASGTWCVGFGAGRAKQRWPAGCPCAASDAG